MNKKKIIFLLFIGCFLVMTGSCTKEDPKSSSSNDKENIYRDWAKKGVRKPAPRLWDQKQ